MLPLWCLIRSSPQETSVENKANKKKTMKPFSTVLLLCGAAATLGSAMPQRGIFGGIRALLDGGLSRGVRQQSGGGGSVSAGSGACRASGTNHKFGGRGYLVSWRLGCTEFTQVCIGLD